LQSAQGCTPGGLPGGGEQWLTSIKDQIPNLLLKNQELGFKFIAGQRPPPNAKGITPTTMEWARRLTSEDIKILTGKAPYCDKLPNVDAGFTQFDLADPKKRAAIIKIIKARLDKANKEKPLGYLVREAPGEEIKQLANLVGHLQAGAFLTKFRKV